MTDNKQYPELPTHFMLVQESFRDEVYLYTADQMRAYVDADRAMRAAQAAPAAWRHSRTLGLFDIEEDVPLADGDEWAEPLYLHPPEAPASQPAENTWAQLDAMRSELATDIREVFDANGPETPQIVRDVIEYADSWLQAYIQRKAESPTQPAAPASQDAEDAARYRWLRRKVAIVGDSFHILNIRPTFVAPDPAVELDAVLDAAMAGETK